VDKTAKASPVDRKALGTRDRAKLTTGRALEHAQGPTPHAQEETVPPRFLQLADVAEELSISPRQAYALVNSGDLPAIRVRGQWRIGLDSALYRSLGHNLASGNGYKFRGEEERQAFPGLPILLAGVERVFGPRDAMHPTLELCGMLGIALLTLWAIHATLIENFPRWLAVCVTTGVGLNKSFSQHAHEIMTDMPFLLGVSLTFLGASRWNRRQGSAKALAGMTCLLGVVLAASMRPTALALLAAGVAALLVRLIRRKNWIALGGACFVLFIILAAGIVAYTGMQSGPIAETDSAIRLADQSRFVLLSKKFVPNSFSHHTLLMIQRNRLAEPITATPRPSRKRRLQYCGSLLT